MAKKINSVNEYITSRKPKAFELADKILKEMDNKVEGAPLNQLASVFATILDRFGAEDKTENSEGLLAKVFEDFEDVK